MEGKTVSLTGRSGRRLWVRRVVLDLTDFVDCDFFGLARLNLVLDLDETRFGLARLPRFEHRLVDRQG